MFARAQREEMDRQREQQLMLDMDPTEVGGVEIASMSHIPERERMANVCFFFKTLLCSSLLY